jgi:hypothetical protein
VGWTLLMIQLGFKVLPKSLPVSSEQGRYELIKDYVEITKYRWNHSSNHLEEIKMYNDIANLNK